MSPRGCRFRHFSPAFTLVEMLLVVAIITLLIALLLPALSRARDAARVTVCASNHHQVGLSMTGFAVSNNRRFPLNPAHNTGYGPALFQISNNKTTSLVTQLRPYTGTFDIFRCPTNADAPAPDHASNTGATLVWAFWYLANYKHAGGVYTSKVRGLSDYGAWAYYSDIIHSHGGWIGPYAANHIRNLGFSNPVQSSFAGSPTARWNVVNDTALIAGANVLAVDGRVTFTAFNDLQQVFYGSLHHWYGRQ
ncbi:MAG: hypothetical protein WD768_16215 [Phycisphaeraceae bacterium]